MPPTRPKPPAESRASQRERLITAIRQIDTANNRDAATKGGHPALDAVLDVLTGVDMAELLVQFEQRWPGRVPLPSAPPS